MAVQTLASMKKSRQTDIEKLTREAEKMVKGNRQADDRYWYPTQDKAGNGSALIRFLPAPKGEDFPFVRYWTHSFKGKGGWYIERSLTSLGKDVKDPVGEYNSELWATDTEANKKIAKKQKRKLNYVAGVYIVNDPGNPENNGKVFLYRFGKKIFDMINTKMKPEFDGDAAINVFDFWDGANFKLRVYKTDASDGDKGFNNYDKSTFEEPSALFDNDDDIGAVWAKQYSLLAEVAPSKYKTYAELKREFLRAIGQKDDVGSADDEGDDERPRSAGRSTEDRLAGRSEPAAKTREAKQPEPDAEHEDQTKSADGEHPDEEESPPPAKVSRPVATKPADKPKADKAVQSTKPEPDNADDFFASLRGQK